MQAAEVRTRAQNRAVMRCRLAGNCCSGTDRTGKRARPCGELRPQDQLEVPDLEVVGELRVAGALMDASTDSPKRPDRAHTRGPRSSVCAPRASPQGRVMNTRRALVRIGESLHD